LHQKGLQGPRQTFTSLKRRVQDPHLAFSDMSVDIYYSALVYYKKIYHLTNGILCRILSLLAHHHVRDYSQGGEDIVHSPFQPMETRVEEEDIDQMMKIDSLTSSMRSGMIRCRRLGHVNLKGVPVKYKYLAWYQRASPGI
jgi:hypothetical protein